MGVCVHMLKHMPAHVFTWMPLLVDCQAGMPTGTWGHSLGSLRPYNRPSPHAPQPAQRPGQEGSQEAIAPGLGCRTLVCPEGYSGDGRLRGVGVGDRHWVCRKMGPVKGVGAGEGS